MGRMKHQEDSLPLATLALVNSQCIAKEHGVNLTCCVDASCLIKVSNMHCDSVACQVLAFIICCQVIKSIEDIIRTHLMAWSVRFWIISPAVKRQA